MTVADELRTAVTLLRQHEHDATPGLADLLAATHEYRGEELTWPADGGGTYVAVGLRGTRGPRQDWTAALNVARAINGGSR